MFLFLTEDNQTINIEYLFCLQGNKFG